MFGAPIEILGFNGRYRLTLDTIALASFGYRFNSFYQRELHPFIEAMMFLLKEAGAKYVRH